MQSQQDKQGAAWFHYNFVTLAQVSVLLTISFLRRLIEYAVFMRGLCMSRLKHNVAYEIVF